MTDDLVQRLRRTYLKEYAPTGSMVGDISNRLRPFPILATEVLFNPDGREAADRIEALQAEHEQAAAEERAKIVAWLRSRDQLEDCYSELQDDWLSNRIEAREHEIPQETSNEALS